MSTYRLVNCINLSKCTVKNKALTSLFVCDRHFCSKENKNDKISSKDGLSKDQEENDNEKAMKVDKFSVKAIISKDAAKSAAKRKLMSLLSGRKNDNEKAMKVDKSSVKEIISEDATKLAAKQKLMSLLSRIKIATDEHVERSNLNLSKPMRRMSKKDRLKKMQDEVITPEKKMDMAVNAVASSFKEESEKVKSELIAKLSTLELSKEEGTIEEDANVKDSELNNQMNENLMTSVEQVAETISESPILPRSELAKRLMRLSLDQELASDKKSVRAVIEGMTIEPQKSVPPPPPPPPPPPLAKIEDRQREKPQASKTVRKLNLFGSAPLNIFTPDTEAKTNSTNDFWQELQERELRLMTQFAPANAFEEMILWTEQGKHWKFPIDNEIDWHVENKTGFHEHVFLEHHLKGFPTKGPVRQFMELVIVGLSKCPYITAERKVENIEWFRNYFKEKEDILKEEGALD